MPHFLPSHRIRIPPELESIAARASASDDDFAEQRIMVRGPENDYYWVVAGVKRFVVESRDAVVEVIDAGEGEIDDYTIEERQALISAFPKVQLADHIKRWLDKVSATAPMVQSIWLFGSRANDLERANSDWDLLAFGASGVLRYLPALRTILRDDVDLFVREGEEMDAVNPCGIKSIPFSAFEWHKLSDDCAEYTGTKGSRHAGHSDGRTVEHLRRRAIRIWPTASG